VTITADSTVRSVLRHARSDPLMARLVQNRVFSPPHIGLAIASYTLFIGGGWAYLSGYIPWVAMVPIVILGIYAGFTPLHDATHRAASTDARVNDLLGTISGFLMFPGLRTRVYRVLHTEHHRWVGDRHRDPDYWLVTAPKPLLPLALALPESIWIHWYLKNLWATRSTRDRIDFLGVMAVYFGVQIGFLLSPWAWEFILIYVIPQKLTVLMTAYGFAHIQHPDDTDWSDSPFDSTVHLRGGPLNFNKVFWLGQGDHCLHHFFPHIPFHRYRGAWQLGSGVLTRQSIPERGLLSARLTEPRPPANQRELIKATVIGRDTITADIDQFVLAPTDGALPAFAPGSHVELHLPSGTIRHYSMAGSPTADTYTIAIKREQAGRGGSLEAHRELTIGATVHISPPRNDFEFVDHDGVVLVAGGIGITPLLSMAHSMSERDRSFTLHACGRDTASIPFADRLEELPFGDNVELRADTPDGRPGFDPERDLGRWAEGRALYVCGPPGFMDYVTTAARTLDWPERAIHTESFGVAPIDVDHDEPFTLRLNRSGRSIEIPAGKPIIDMLSEAHVDVDWSCGQGVCGTCVTPVLSGVPRHRDAVLTLEERQSNKLMCLCVSRSYSNEIVIDL